MQVFFVLLAVITTTLLSAAIVLGLQAGPLPAPKLFSDAADPLLIHFYLGLVGTVSCLITHVWVFFYFIGTGEGIREGVIAHRLDPDAIRRTKRFKAKTFPFALFAMLFMITAAILGGGLRFARVPGWLHMVAAYFALAFNLFAFAMEYKTIGENRRLMADLNRQIV